MRLLSVALAIAVLLPFAACTKRHDDNPNYLNIASPEKFKGMDPALGEDIYQTAAEVLVFESLLTYHPFKRPYTLVPLTAEAMPEVSKDGLTYTFKIRHGIMFTDDPAFPNGAGRELTAKDYEYSLKRIGDPRLHSNAFWLFENRIVGLDEWKAKYEKAEKTNYDEDIPGIKVVDDHTLRLQLKLPYPQLLNALAMSSSVAVAREVVEKYGAEFMNHPIGTGAFIVTDFQLSDHLTYKKNPKYWGTFPTDADSPKEDSGKQLPMIDGINFRVMVEDQPRWLHFMKGELDRLPIPKDNFDAAVRVKDKTKPSSVDNVELMPDVAAKGIELYGGVSMDLTYDAINNTSTQIPQFKDKRVRCAISLALDYSEAIPLLYNNRAIAAQTPIPPTLAGYDPNYRNPYRTHDLALAKKLLAQAGYPDGKGFPVIPFDSTADATAREFAEYVRRQLEPIGIKIEVVSNTWPAMLKRIQNREAQLWGMGWGADYPDAENFLQLFYGKNAYQGGSNQFYYKNDAYDRLFEKARVMGDSPERSAMYQKLARMVAEDCPVVFGVHRIDVRLRHTWIKNDAYDDQLPFARAKFLRIEQDTKKKYGE